MRRISKAQRLHTINRTTFEGNELKHPSEDLHHKCARHNHINATIARQRTRAMNSSSQARTRTASVRARPLAAGRRQPPSRRASCARVRNLPRRDSTRRAPSGLAGNYKCGRLRSSPESMTATKRALNHCTKRKAGGLAPTGRGPRASEYKFGGRSGAAVRLRRARQCAATGQSAHQLCRRRT